MAILLEKEIISCRRCPRLVAYRESVPARKSYENEDYWRLPVPGYGDPKAWLLILGLAPSAHGGNRTGRIFTGDESAKFLFKALHEVGLANQPTSERLDDGLKLKGCYITPIVKCVPPANKPTAQECKNCRPFLEKEMELLPHLTTVLALGKMAYDSLVKGKNPFKHGACYQLNNSINIYSSYHPSPQNTFTKKLTHSMLTKLLNKIINK